MKQILYLCQRRTLLVALAFAFFIGSLMGVAADAGEIADQFVRFHIVANSNSEEDQMVKWKVREVVFSKLDLSPINSKESAMEYFALHQEEVENIANEVLETYHFPYQCKVTVGKKEFPVREYSDFVLPAGVYDAVSITLGQGNGQNFFCVMYPSLCMIEGVTEKTESNQAVLNHVLTEEQVCAITGNKKELVYKFKIVEWMNQFFS